MKLPISKLIVVLPCHSLEDFPTHYRGDDAESLLANWTTLWHPALIAKAASAPTWMSQDFVNQDLTGALLLSPTLCGRLPIEVEEAVEKEQAVLIDGKTNRSQILDSPLIKRLTTDAPDDSLVNDFFALGYAFLQIQIMTRQLRYSTTLNSEEFDLRLLAAARAVEDRNQEIAYQKLTSCFDLLLEEKNNYYPGEPHLIDYVLVPPSGNLKDQLAANHKFNVGLSADAVDRIQNENASRISNLKSLLDTNQVGFASSGRHELITPLVSIESIVHQIRSANANLQQKLGISNQTYGSFQLTLTPQLPAILDQFKFESAIHSTFFGGQVPRTSSPVINWQGQDGTNIPALSVTPIDANSSDGFLNLGLKIGEMLDAHHHAELLFVHWPSKVSDAFQDLIRTEKYGALLGRFKTLSEFNNSIYDSGFSDTFESEDYKFPFLEEAWQKKIPNPISLWTAYWRLTIQIRSLKSAMTLAALAGLGNFNSGDLDVLTQIQIELDRCTANHSSMHSIVKQIEMLVASSPIQELTTMKQPQSPIPNGKFINPSAFATTSFLRRENETAVVRLDAFGMHQTSVLPNIIQPQDPNIIHSNPTNDIPSLRNEYFEVTFEESSGGIKSVNRHERKGNLFSQRLAARLSQTVFERGYPRQKSKYTSMRSAGWEIGTNQRHSASITTTGGLFDGESKIADFDQTVSVNRGDRKIYFDVRIRLNQAILGPPWRNYIANRVAWSDEDAVISRSENEISERAYQEKFSAPNFAEIQTKDARISVLPGGLPFHRRSHRRMLDTLLVVEHETCRRFEFAIAVDAPTAIGAATDYLAPIYLFATEAYSNANGWLFHLNCKNVALTNLEPTLNEFGKISGVKMRIQETEGRPGDLNINCPRTVKSAQRTNLKDQHLFDLKCTGEVVHCSFLAYQYFQIQIDFCKHCGPGNSV